MLSVQQGTLTRKVVAGQFTVREVLSVTMVDVPVHPHTLLSPVTPSVPCEEVSHRHYSYHHRLSAQFSKL